MSTAGRSGRGPGWWMALILAVTGCEVTEEGPRDIPLAEAEAAVRSSLCERVFDSCRCEQWQWYADEQECAQDVAESMATIQEALDSPLGASLTYDPACMGEYVYLLDRIGCGTDFVDPVDECQTPCLLVYGTRTEGDSCELYGDWISDCAQGLVCYGTCERPCSGDEPAQVAGEGESCFDRPCAEDLLCDFGGDEICKVLPEAGSPCVLGQCAEGAFCEATDPLDPMSEQLCYAPRGLEQPCRGHGQCQSGYCPAGFCAEIPRRGESCAGVGVCAPGLACVDEVCDLGDSLLCSVPVPSV